MKPGPLFTLAGLLVLAALMLMPISGGEFEARHLRLFGELENAAHPLIFMAIASYALAWLRSRGTPGAYFKAFVLAFLLGALTEAAQRLTARDGSLVDLRNDCLGAAFILLWHARQDLAPDFHARARRALGMAAILCATFAALPLAWAGAAYAQRDLRAPLLWRHQSPLDNYFFHAIGPGNTGFELTEPWPDWRGYRELAIDVSNPQDSAMPVTVRVHDRWHNQEHVDRYNETFTLPPRSRQVLRIPVERILRAPRGRPMDLQQIGGIVIFQPAAKRSRPFAVNSMGLK